MVHSSVRPGKLLAVRSGQVRASDKAGSEETQEGAAQPLLLGTNRATLCTKDDAIGCSCTKPGQPRYAVPAVGSLAESSGAHASVRVYRILGGVRGRSVQVRLCHCIAAVHSLLNARQPVSFSRGTAGMRTICNLMSPRQPPFQRPPRESQSCSLLSNLQQPRQFCWCVSLVALFPQRIMHAPDGRSWMCPVGCIELRRSMHHRLQRCRHNIWHKSHAALD